MGKPTPRSPRGMNRNSGFEGHVSTQAEGYKPHGKVDPTRMRVKQDFIPRVNQKSLLRAIDRHDLTFLVGPAGTGKTVLPVIYAINLLLQGQVSKIVAVRPAVEAGDSVGFLTGDLYAKMAPYLRPVLDSFEKFLGRENLEKLIAAGFIEITSLTYLRGRTIEDAVYIMDEMQNATPAQLKMCLTRIGENCTAVVTMDPGQCDIPEDASCYHELTRFRGKPSIAVIDIPASQVVRSELVKTILSCY